jgi:hypothetical protein
MKHVHTFMCSVLALQNAWASGKLLPRWSPRTRLGLNLGPSPNNARNVYLVLNLMTGCVSPQYHCWFDEFFETTHHGGPDVSDTICWQQLAGLSCTAQIFSDHAWPTQFSTVSQTIPLENRPDDLDDFSMPQVDFDIVIDGESFADGESQATGSSGAKLLTKLRELLQLNLWSQLVLAEAEEFALCQGRWPNPHHSGTSLHLKMMMSLKRITKMEAVQMTPY